MWRLTSADKGRRDSKASFRDSEKNESGLWQALPDSCLHLSTFRPGAAVDNLVSLMWCTGAIWVVHVSELDGKQLLASPEVRFTKQ